MRQLLTSVAELLGLTLITAGAAQAFGHGVGLIVGGVSLVVVGVTQA